MARLHPDRLGKLNTAVQLPAYDREATRPGILHLGLGAFHRAHQAVFTEQAMASSGGDWGIIGVSLRSNRVSRQLLPQGGLYSVLSEDARGQDLRVIGAIRDVLVAPGEPERVIAAIADPAIRIITLTITEKGYCLAPDGQSLDVSDPQVASDLADPEKPSSAVGLLALGLRERVAAGGAPLTVISCDNLAENSRHLQSVLREYLSHTFAGILPWLEHSVAFPCSMVDRIVPAMTSEQKTRQAELLGALDEGAVSTEPFSQWIIENRFATERPDWEIAGVQLVEDILPFEDIKLRLLNASHSAIAYSGALAGLETVDQVVADQDLGCWVKDLMTEELMPALNVPEGFDVKQYRDSLLERFGNPRLGHRCLQIAMDGTEKIPQRWLPTLQRGESPLLVKALSTWCYFILCTKLDIDDPRSDHLLSLRESDRGLPERLRGVLDCARINAGSDEYFEGLCEALLNHMDVIRENGIRGLVGVGSRRINASRS
jgi:fructuronate reductase